MKRECGLWSKLCPQSRKKWPELQFGNQLSLKFMKNRLFLGGLLRQEFDKKRALELTGVKPRTYKYEGPRLPLRRLRRR